MKITRLNSDYIEINEENIYDDNLLSIPRVHLIKFSFINPDEVVIGNVLKLYQKTNRFVIEDNIRIYNYILKSTNKKYYVENQKGAALLSFFRKNNKVLVNFLNLTNAEKEFLLSDDCFEDLLKHTEVIKIDKKIFDEKEDMLNNWSGNVIII